MGMIYKFRIEDSEGRFGYTDYGTKQQMAALYAEANTRMERFKKGLEIENIRIDKFEDGDGEQTVYCGKWNNWYIYYEGHLSYDSKSHRDLSKAMNEYYKEWTKED